MSETELIVAALIVWGVALLAVLAFAGRSMNPEVKAGPASSFPGLGGSIGMLLGAMLGVIVWVATGHFVFWVIFMGGGLVSGFAVGESWRTRHR